MKDPVYDVYWEGPFSWERRRRVVHPTHVLYSIHGTHPVYGPTVPLYIGKTERGGVQRLDEHHWWVKDECDVVIRLASIGVFKDWETWDDPERYPKAPPDTIASVEQLLIHANQLAYNSQGIQELHVAKHFRVFNSGEFGQLLPEVSTRYYVD